MSVDMTWFVRSALSSLFLWACGGDVPGPIDGGDPDAGIHADAEPPDGGCPARASGRLGPGGGTLVHCDGARLEVPPGALAAETELFVERLEAAPAPPLPYVLAGPAFRFGPEDVRLSAPARFDLPHDGGARMEMAALVDDAWVLVEVCDSDDSVVTQSFASLGTLAAARDPNVYPEGPTGLGDGAVDFTFGETADRLEAIYAIDQDVGEARALTLVYRRTVGDALEQLDVRLHVSVEGVVEPLQVAYANTATGEIWDVLELLDPDALDVSLTRADGDALEGTIDATLRLGDQRRPLTATFTATVVEWRYPPERSCGMPPEG